MPSNTRGSQADKIEATCTTAAADSILTPKGPDIFFATAITFAGNSSFVLGREYVITVQSKN